MQALLWLLLGCIACAAATWESRWKKSTWKESEGAAGEFKLSAGKWFGDEEMDKGIQTAQDSKFSAIYAEMPQTVDNTGKDLVVQVGTARPLVAGDQLDCI